MNKLFPYDRSLLYGYAPGAFPAHALLDARPEIARRLLLHSKAANGEGIDRLRARCAALRVREEEADRILRSISRKDNCFAAIVFDKYESTLSGYQPHIVLHQPSDMGNLGTIFRTCLGFGFHNIAIIRPSADYFDPRVVRASMGALFSLNIMEFDTFDEYRQLYPKHALFPFMLTGACPLSRAVSEKKEPYALIFGNEAKGLPEDFATLGQPVRIPHSHAIDSLNLAVAVAIAAQAFYEEGGNSE